MNNKLRADPFAESPGHARERIRLSIADSRISSARIQGFPTSDEDEVREAGYANLHEYFQAALAMPMTIEAFISFIERFHLEPTCSSDQTLDAAVRRALKIAVRSKQPFIYADPQTHELKKLHLDPRAAAVWLLSLPTERGLLSPELRKFLEGNSLPDLRERPIAAPTTAGKATRRNPGRRAATQLPDVVFALRHLYPFGPPTPNRKAMIETVKAAIGRNVSLQTLDRARKQAWPIE